MGISVAFGKQQSKSNIIIFVHDKKESHFSSFDFMEFQITNHISHTCTCSVWRFKINVSFSSTLSSSAKKNINDNL